MPEKDAFTLEKLEIQKRQIVLEAKFDVLLTKIEFQTKETTDFRSYIKNEFDELCNAVKDVKHAINGTASTIGLAEKVRNIEDIKTKVSKLENLEDDIKELKIFKAAVIGAWLILITFFGDWALKHWPG